MIVLLHNPSALELEVTNWQPDILLQDFLIECRIHDSINYGKWSRSWSCKAAPDNHTTTTMFDCWYDVLFMKCCVGFTADVMGHTHLPKSSTFVASVHRTDGIEYYYRIFGVTISPLKESCKKPCAAFIWQSDIQNPNKRRLDLKQTWLAMAWHEQTWPETDLA